jgi:hypothetical protein
VAVLLSELWWVALVAGCAEGVRRGISQWAVLPAAFIIDITLSLRVEAQRPLWLWLVNVVVLSVVLQLAGAVAAVEALRDVPDDPPPSPPTDALREIAAGLRGEGFAPVTEEAVLIGDPEMHLWVLLRADGTVAETIHREPRPPGFSFATWLEPPAPGYDKIVSVPWARGWPEPGARRVERPKATWSALLDAHDAAVAEATAAGARPAPVRSDDALARVLAGDRATVGRVMERPWRSMVGAHLRGLRRAAPPT